MPRSLLLALVLAGAAFGQPLLVELYPGGTPGAPSAPGEEQWEQRGQGWTDRSVRNVHRPTVTVYPASPEISLGAAVVIAPGGGYRHLAIDKEGHDVAKWLAAQGVTGIVLKYRLPHTEGAGYTRATPLDDMRQAIRLVRGRAAEWGLDPGRLGVMGFSAGGDLAARASFEFPDGEAEALAPNFTVLGYMAYFEPPAAHPLTPPAFLVHAFDDRVDANTSIAYFQALKKAGIPAELHIYAEGGHGFGMLERGLPVSGWPLRLEAWLARLGLVR